MKKNLDITKPRYSEQILPVPRSLIISRFHGSTRFSELESYSLQLFSMWPRGFPFVCIYIIKFVHDQVLYACPNFCVSANSTG